jgi:hypothetical protein
VRARIPELTDGKSSCASSAPRRASGGSEKLQKLAGALLDHRDGDHVAIEGHTDASGSNDYNLKLSQQRAEAVRRGLFAGGRRFDVDRVSARRGQRLSGGDQRHARRPSAESSRDFFGGFRIWDDSDHEREHDAVGPLEQGMQRSLIAGGRGLDEHDPLGL